jgi:cytochrome c556
MTQVDSGENMVSVARLSTAFILVAACLTTPLYAAPADDVHSRVDGLRQLGAAFKTVRDGLRGDEVQTVLIQMAARQIRNSAKAQYGWFPVGSGPASGVKTTAKAEIWSQPAKFKAAQDAFAAEAAVFQQIAAGGNPAAIRAEAAKLGGTCKACHDDFRTEEH